MTTKTTGTAPLIERLILDHRKASMRLQSAMTANGRRGASADAADEVNRAGEAMAQSERDLLAAITAPPAAVPDGSVLISRELAYILHEIMYKSDQEPYAVTAEDRRSIYVVHADELRDQLRAALTGENERE